MMGDEDAIHKNDEISKEGVKLESKLFLHGSRTMALYSLAGHGGTPRLTDIGSLTSPLP